LGKLLRRGQHNPKAVLKSICPGEKSRKERELKIEIDHFVVSELTNQDLNAFEFYPSVSGSDDVLPGLLLTLHDRQRVTGFKFGLV
jgi:hypothetical protein